MNPRSSGALRFSLRRNRSSRCKVSPGRCGFRARAGSTSRDRRATSRSAKIIPSQVAWGRRGRLCEVGVGVWLNGFMRGDDATQRMGVQKVKEMIEELCRECSKRNGEIRATGLMVAKAKLSEARRGVGAASKPKTRKRKARVGKS